MRRFALQSHSLSVGGPFVEPPDVVVGVFVCGASVSINFGKLLTLTLLQSLALSLFSKHVWSLYMHARDDDGVPSPSPPTKHPAGASVAPTEMW